MRGEDVYDAEFFAKALSVRVARCSCQLDGRLDRRRSLGIGKPAGFAHSHDVAN